VDLSQPRLLAAVVPFATILLAVAIGGSGKPAVAKATTLRTSGYPHNCAGTVYPTSRPFLIPPYQGFAQLDSYFDHDYPDYNHDNLLTIANGRSFSNSEIGLAPIDPRIPSQAYWSQGLRQYVFYDGHNGYDFGLNFQPVYAAARGTVLFAGWDFPGASTKGYGRMIVVDDGSGYATLYGHLSRIQVHVGEVVKAGMQLGVSGDSGHSTGPHLHFTVFHNCTVTDPYGWTGAGPDPLATYQGESSVYLWRQPPKLLNPISGWPGLRQMPAPNLPNALNLKLPPEATLPQFLARIDGERKTVSAALRRLHIPVRYDWTTGAFLFPHPVKSSILASLPAASSITPDTFDALYWSSQSLDAAIAYRSSTVEPAHTLGGHFGRAFVFSYRGHRYLLGRGHPKQTVELRVPHSSAMPIATVSRADGAFALPIEAPIADRDQLLLTSASGSILLTVERHANVSKVTTHPAPPPANRTASRPSPDPAPATQGTLSRLEVFVPGGLTLALMMLIAIRFARCGRSDTVRNTGDSA
jgi:murein DD-endopeptidase MepM/ murein hydrolase activator NlpD